MQLILKRLGHAVFYLFESLNVSSYQFNSKIIMVYYYSRLYLGIETVSHHLFSYGLQG